MSRFQQLLLTLMLPLCCWGVCAPTLEPGSVKEAQVLLRRPHPYERVTAAEYLYRHRAFDDGAREVLLHTIAQANPLNRRRAALLLARAGAPGHEQAVIDALRLALTEAEHASAHLTCCTSFGLKTAAEVQLEILHALERLKGREANALIAWFYEMLSARLLAQAPKSFGMAAPRNGDDLIREWELRLNAALLLPQFKGYEARSIDILLSALTVYPDESWNLTDIMVGVLLTGIQSLSRTPEAHLLPLLDDTRSYVVHRGLQGLQCAAPSSARAPSIRALMHPDFSVRELAYKFLSRSEDEQALEAAAAYRRRRDAERASLLNSPDPSTRIRAIREQPAASLTEAQLNFAHERAFTQSVPAEERRTALEILSIFLHAPAADRRAAWRAVIDHEEIIRLLRDTDDGVRIAVMSLLQAEDLEECRKAATPALQALLAHPTLRPQAMRLLWESKDEEIRTALVTELIHDLDSEESHEARARLEEIGPKAVPLLLAALEQPNPKRQIGVLVALRSIPSPAAIEQIAALAESPDEEVRRHVYYSLWAIDTPEAQARAIPLLPAFLKEYGSLHVEIRHEDSAPVQAAIARELTRRRAALQSNTPEEIQLAALFIVRFDATAHLRPAASILFEMLGDNRMDFRSRGEALLDMLTADQLATLLPVLIRKVGSEQPAIRAAAARLLNRVPGEHPEVVSAMTRLLEERGPARSFDEARLVAAAFLVERRSKQAVLTLTELLDNPDLASEALGVLAKAGEAARPALPAVLESLAYVYEPTPVAAIVTRLIPDQGRSFFLKALRHENSKVRRQAFIQLTEGPYANDPELRTATVRYEDEERKAWEALDAQAEFNYYSVWSSSSTCWPTL